MALALRREILAGLEHAPEPVALLLSGGADSSSLLFALRELGKEVVAYSFMLDGKLSTDFRDAQRAAGLFGVSFRPVFLPRDAGTLIRDVRWLVNDLGLRKKTAIECTWPRSYAIRQAAEDGAASLATGDGADIYFGLSKKAMLHYKGSVETMDELRATLYANPHYAQMATTRRLAEELGMPAIYPYKSPEVFELFLGRSWEFVNKPVQKAVIRAAFPEGFRRVRVGPHVILQGGDSGIIQHFEQLLNGPLNRRKCRSVIGVYNDVAKEGGGGR